MERKYSHPWQGLKAGSLRFLLIRQQRLRFIRIHKAWNRPSLLNNEIPPIRLLSPVSVRVASRLKFLP
jgi:hypothetical protein